MTEWVHKKLGECCESELGKTLDEGRNTGLYRPYLCALNVLWGKIDLSTIKQMRIEEVERERYLVKKGDLLVCEGGEIGRCAIWENDDEIYYQNALHRVRFYKEYDAYFFMYLLCHYNDLKLIEQYGKGLTIKHLNQAAFRSIPVCVPSLPAQRRIAAILSSADKVIASTQKVIAKYKQMKQGLMEDLLKPKEGWKMVRLGECLTIGNGQDYKHLLSGDIPVYGTGGVMTYVDDYLYEGETVCIGRKGTINKPIFHVGKIWTVDTLFYTHSFIDVSPLFIYYVFCNTDWNKYNEATGVPSLSKETIYKIEIPVPFKNNKPDLTEQRRIASILSGIDAKIAAEKKVLEKYNLIKKGLMERLMEE